MIAFAALMLAAAMDAYITTMMVVVAGAIDVTAWYLVASALGADV